MADKSYDAIIIGGGTKGLTLAIYLAKYGKMDVAVFERRHELGGGWATEESPAPGFMSNNHANNIAEWYLNVYRWDFPDFEEKGVKWIPYKVSCGAIFREDHSCITFYGKANDPSHERTASEIARFSQKDADTYLKHRRFVDEVFGPASLEYFHNPPTPPGVPDAVERALERAFSDPDLGIDPSWIFRSPLQVMRDVFESEALIAALLRIAYQWTGNSPDMDGGGLFQYMGAFGFDEGFGCMRGGTHTFAHATYRILIENGGATFTKHEVDKILIENGRAKGVRLLDGTDVEARKLVVSTLDPETLCFRFIGKDYFNPKVLRRVANLERKAITINWYFWAVHELPKYKAASFNPDINDVGSLFLGNKDPEILVKECCWRKLGKIPPELTLQLMPNAIVDKTQAPEGKYNILHEQFTVPASALTEKGWREYKKSHAEQVIKTWHEYAPNMTWDNVIGYAPNTPFDVCRNANMAPEGNWGVIDQITSQWGRWRPIPEMSGYRTPINNLYATGAAWHPGGGGMACNGYNCYKIIAEDFGLEKPWKKDGRPY